MSPVARILFRFGYVRLKDYGYTLTPEGKMVELPSGTSDWSLDAAPALPDSRSLLGLPVEAARNAPPPVPRRAAKAIAAPAAHAPAAIAAPAAEAAAIAAPPVEAAAIAAAPAEAAADADDSGMTDEEEWEWRMAVAAARARADQEAAAPAAAATAAPAASSRPAIRVEDAREAGPVAVARGFAELMVAPAASADTDDMTDEEAHQWELAMARARQFRTEEVTREQAPVAASPSRRSPIATHQPPPLAAAPLSDTLVESHDPVEETHVDATMVESQPAEASDSERSLSAIAERTLSRLRAQPSPQPASSSRRSLDLSRREVTRTNITAVDPQRSDRRAVRATLSSLTRPSVLPPRQRGGGAERLARGTNSPAPRQTTAHGTAPLRRPAHSSNPLAAGSRDLRDTTSTKIDLRAADGSGPHDVGNYIDRLALDDDHTATDTPVLAARPSPLPRLSERLKR